MAQPTNFSPSNSTTTPTPPHPFRPIFLTLMVVCPVLALLPPRKLDLYTFTLSGTWVYSATELAYSHPRRLRLQQQQQQRIGMSASDSQGSVNETLRPDPDEDEGQDEQEEEEDEGGIKSLARKIWMGNERPGWQRRRLEKEKEELESGKGYGDIIMEQVREVFPGFGGGRNGEERDEEEEEGEDG